MNRFMLRLLSGARPRKAFDIMTSTALAEWPASYEKARRAAETGGDPILAHYYAAMAPIVADLPADKPLRTTLEGNPECRIVALWAAHFLPEGLYRQFARLVSADQNATLFMAFLKAEDSVEHLRPALSSAPAKKATAKPQTPPVETVDTHQARAAWKADSLFRIWATTAEEAAAQMREFSADDLQALVSAVEGVEFAPMILAVAEHPMLDRGTALDILFVMCAEGYQRYWREGRSEDSFCADQQTLFRAFDRIARRAEAGQFRSARFQNRLHQELEPPRVYRRVSGSMIRLLFRWLSSVRRMPPLLRAA